MTLNATRRLPLVVVLGATACGKSKLAIELAQRFSGEIISADSMQVYKNLDIVTNKVNPEERRLVKHHLIDFVDPLERYSIVDFRDKAIEIIDNLLKANKLPIVVGGTHYYLESIIWKNFILSHDEPSTKDYIISDEFERMKAIDPNLRHTDKDYENPELLFNKPIFNDAFADVPSEKLWKILEKVDPVSAHTYHPHDKRRIIRCLQIMQQKQTSFTDLMQELNDLNGKFSRGGPLRYLPTCVFWVHSDKEHLSKIVEQRVDAMLERGLIEELEEFHDRYNKQRLRNNLDPDYTKGIFQTIGFKEFHAYLTLPDDESKQSEMGQKLLKESIDQLKHSTRRYANKQIKWIRRRMLAQSQRDLPPIFKLDASDSIKWDAFVKNPAIEAVQCIADGTNIPDYLLASMQEPEQEWHSINNPGKFYCEACEKLFIGSYYWSSHLQSKSHQKRVSKQKQDTSNQVSSKAVDA